MLRKSFRKHVQNQNYLQNGKLNRSENRIRSNLHSPEHTPRLLYSSSSESHWNLDPYRPSD